MSFSLFIRSLPCARPLVYLSVPQLSQQVSFSSRPSLYLSRNTNPLQIFGRECLSKTQESSPRSVPAQRNSLVFVVEQVRRGPVSELISYPFLTHLLSDMPWVVHFRRSGFPLRQDSCPSPGIHTIQSQRGSDAISLQKRGGVFSNICPIALILRSRKLPIRGTIMLQSCLVRYNHTLNTKVPVVIRRVKKPL